MRLIVREAGSPPDVFWHDEVLPSGPSAYEGAVLWMDGLRLEGWFVRDHYRDKSVGYEDWTFEDVAQQGRANVIVSLTQED